LRWRHRRSCRDPGANRLLLLGIERPRLRTFGRHVIVADQRPQIGFLRLVGNHPFGIRRHRPQLVQIKGRPRTRQPPTVTLTALGQESGPLLVGWTFLKLLSGARSCPTWAMLGPRPARASTPTAGNRRRSPAASAEAQKRRRTACLFVVTHGFLASCTGPFSHCQTSFFHQTLRQGSDLCNW
jgi:hypothetical protein